MTPEAIRKDLITFVHEELVGPRDNRTEVILGQLPHKKYISGILFPRRMRIESDQSEEDADAAPESGDAPAEATLKSLDLPEPHTVSNHPRPSADRLRAEAEEADEGVSLANADHPSAISLTFAVRPEVTTLRVEPHASSYFLVDPADIPSGEEARRWRRSTRDFGWRSFPLESGHRADRLIEGCLTLRVTARPTSNSRRLVTVSLCNDCKGDPNQWIKAEECFFQTGFSVEAEGVDAPFLEMPLGDRRRDDEERSLELLYRHRKVYARGHGCAATWEKVEGDGDEPEQVVRVATDTLPAVKVPPVEPLSLRQDAFSMEKLGGEGLVRPEHEIPEMLIDVPQGYAEWIRRQEREYLPLVETIHRDTADRHLRDCRRALARMERGIDLLRHSPRALQAFMLANRAMLMQQVHTRRPRRSPDEAFSPLPERYRSSVSGDRVTGYWRVFQLAFILMTLGAFEGEDQKEERDLVDLIWFPTGGGKTEAYLGLAAFVIFLRRLRWPEDAGCAVLMRYTLRLLTAQQFERASALLCACECLRRNSVDELGREPIRIGLWAGSAVSPNRQKEAAQNLNKMLAGDTDNPFPVRKCAWCGTALDVNGSLGYKVRDGSMRLICPEPRCPFSEEPGLPILVIDEDIYANPPELILGTVDKFAMLAWNQDAGRIFGRNDPEQPYRSPPGLIIQDELHLISGPLGSMVGHYEAVIDYLCHKGGDCPKIIASTATIRRATRQCQDLYGREAFQFPPPGLDASDSYFAVEEKEAPGRIYLGAFPSAASSPVVAQGKVVAALLQGATSAGDDESDDAARDPYWTLVQYFGSLRELGRAFSMMEDEVPEYLKEQARRRGLATAETRWIRRFEEMTSRRSATEIPDILERLERTYDSRSKRGPRALDALLATNMISVGVDVPRLGLMLVVGQPKTTSEYIQASSRVGRGNPGLVVTLYSTSKPRDRSHYEHHRSFHESFYKHVEPTSSTPFSVPVQQRALAALLVIVARQVAGIERPTEFVEPHCQQHVAKFLRFLKERARDLDFDRVEALERRYREIVEQWMNGSHIEWGSHYPKNDMELPLFYSAGKQPNPEWEGDPWPLPTSMRNVDGECHGKIIIRYDVQEDET